MDIDARIAQANGRLKAANVGVLIERVGQRLRVRATLPSKPGSTQQLPSQQRISLGVRANPAGLKVAEAEARKIGALVDCREFDWTPYLKGVRITPKTCRDWVEQFEGDYFQRRSRNYKTQTTWNGDYLKVFKRLPGEQPLTLDLVRELVLKTKPDTKTRKRCCMALGALTKFADIECDLSSLAGNYTPQQVSPRDLPSDEAIVKWYYELKNPSWKWVYGMMATYGLRNHEVFKLDHDQIREGNNVVTVLEDTKTKLHQVWAYYPEWWEEFKLQEVRLPDINLNRSNEKIGHSVTEYFSDFGIPFSPYNLRHCWAVRTLRCRLPHELAAKQMGHSVQVHERTYHRWIKGEVHQQVYDAFLQSGDRPRPPQSS